MGSADETAEGEGGAAAGGGGVVGGGGAEGVEAAGGGAGSGAEGADARGAGPAGEMGAAFEVAVGELEVIRGGGGSEGIVNPVEELGVEERGFGGGGVGEGVVREEAGEPAEVGEELMVKKRITGMVRATAAGDEENEQVEQEGNEVGVAGIAHRDWGGARME